MSIGIKGSASKTGIGGFIERNRKYLVAYSLVMPFYVLFVLFTIIPVLMSILYSFTNFNVLQAPIWIGFTNYTNLFLNDDVFVLSIGNTLVYAVITGPVGYLASFVFAWLINGLKSRVRAIIVVVFFAPSISGSAYFVWQLLFSSDRYGYINSILLKTGIISQPVYWLQNADYVMPVIIVVSLWMSISVAFLAFVAGLKTLDRSLIEQGCVDGVRNRWQELWFIVLPSLKPMLMFGAVMSITGSFTVATVSIQLAGFPSVDYAAHTIVTHLIDYGTLRFEMGYASAIATLLFILMVSINKIVQNLLQKVGS